MQTSSKIFAAAVVAAAALGGATAAQARSDVFFSVGIQAPAPVYVEPAPVYVQPQVVYAPSAPVYVRPAPVYVQPRVVYGHPVYVGHGYAGHRENWRHGEWERRDGRDHHGNRH